MRLRQLIVPAALAVVVHAEVKIEPPSPYMSSPPPAEADTTVIDPGRKPRCEVQPGLSEAWYADWNLSTDKPSGKPLEVNAPRRNNPTFRAAFDDNGWPTELVYYDAKGRPRWTKMFKYPKRIPAGPGEVPYTGSWIGSNGKAIQMDQISQAFKAGKWEESMRKYQVGDVLGEPLMIEVTSVGTTFSAKAETWVYLVDGREVRFSFDKDNRLTALPVLGEAPAPQPVLKFVEAPKPAPEPAKPAKKEPEKAKEQVKPVAEAAKADTAKKIAPEVKTDSVKAPAKPAVADAKGADKPVADSTKAAAVKPEAKPADSAKAKPAPRYRSKSKRIE